MYRSHHRALTRSELVPLERKYTKNVEGLTLGRPKKAFRFDEDRKRRPDGLILHRRPDHQRPDGLALRKRSRSARDSCKSDERIELLPPRHIDRILCVRFHTLGMDLSLITFLDPRGTHVPSFWNRSLASKNCPITPKYQNPELQLLLGICKIPNLPGILN